MEEPAKPLTNTKSQEDGSEPRRADPNRNSLESQESGTGSVFSDHQSSNYEKVPITPYLTEAFSSDYGHITCDWGNGRPVRVSQKDPHNVATMRSISERVEGPLDRIQIDISLSKLKLGMLMGGGSNLGHRRWVTPVQRIEALAPSCPERLPTPVMSPLIGCWPTFQQHALIIGEPQRRLVPQHIAFDFTGQSFPLEVGRTDGESKVHCSLRWRMLTYQLCDS